MEKVRDLSIIALNGQEFNEAVSYFLKSEDKKVCYCSLKDKIFTGGMVDTLEEALELCSKLYEKDKSSELSIGDYSNGVTLWNNIDILYELGFVSDEDYFRESNIEEL